MPSSLHRTSPSSAPPGPPHIDPAAVAAGADDAIVAQDLTGSIRWLNAAAERLYGYGAAELDGQPADVLVPAERREETARLVARVCAGERVAPVETERLARDGRRIVVSVATAPVRDAAGAVVAVSSVARDVTASRDREREIARLSRLYAALGEVGRAVVEASERDALLARICRILVDPGGFRQAWVGWHVPETQRIEPVAAWGTDDEYLASLHLYADDRPGGRGPSGLAFRSGQPYVCTTLADPAIAPWRELLAGRGLAACAAFPIRTRGAVCGILGVYSSEPGFFRDREIALLRKVGEDVSFALDNFARDAERRAAEARAYGEKLFSDTMIESMPGVLYFYDEQGRFLRWNRNFEQVSGYNAAEIARMHPLDFFTPEEQPALRARIDEVFARGESFVEASLRSKDGRTTPYFFTGRRILFDGGAYLVGVGIDVSERRRAEERLRRSEDRFRAIFAMAGVGIALVAVEDGRILRCNRALADLLGYAEEDLAQHTVHQLALPGEDVVDRELWGRLLRGEVERIQMEQRYRRRDGSVVWGWLTATLVRDADATLPFVIGMFEDISERKRAEFALHELNETLEQKVARRTEELHAALLRAEGADRLKSAFLAAMSHELRTPLNSILGFTGMVLQELPGPLNAEQAKQLSMVRASARHLLELINDVLDLSRIEAGQLDVRAEPVDLPALLARVIASVQPLAQHKGLALELHAPADLGAIVSDRRRVEQILINLLGNAIKFTASGRVTLEAQRTAQSQVHLHVTDTGIGIAAEDLATLFQPFRQLDIGLSRQSDGSGLGLAISRRLATLLGGGIAVTSTPGRGSTFTLTLPALPPERA